MFQPTIDTHLLARHIHVQLPLSGGARPDGALASIGAQVLAHQRSTPPFTRVRRMFTLGRRPALSTRPIPASAN